MTKMLQVPPVKKGVRTPINIYDSGIPQSNKMIYSA